jgi:predicted deacylase
MPEFNIAALPQGAKMTGWMSVAPRADGNWWRLPVLAARGNRPGPTLVVLAAVHGDEYEGIEAIPRRLWMLILRCCRVRW